MNSTLIDGATIAAIITWLVSVVKPFVEQLPFAKVDSPTHDATLQLGQLAVNLLTVFALAVVGGTLTAGSIVPLLVQGFAQAAGAEVLYKTLTRSGGSVGGTPAKLLPVLASQTLVSPGTLETAQPAPTAAAPSPDEMPTLQMRAVPTSAASQSGL